MDPGERRSSLSRARRSSAFRFTRSALDGLEAQLALEEAELSNVRAELERVRIRLLETVERCPLGDEASRTRREEALRFAKEVRESAVHEAVETLGTVTAERRATADDRVAAAADRASTEAALTTHDARIVEDSESIRRSLDEYRQRVEARERALDAREAEANRCEEQVAQTELDLNRNREGLETREGDLAQAMAKHEGSRQEG